jgi:hypothetical protein
MGRLNAPGAFYGLLEGIMNYWERRAVQVVEALLKRDPVEKTIPNLTQLLLREGYAPSTAGNYASKAFKAWGKPRRRMSLERKITEGKKQQPPETQQIANMLLFAAHNPDLQIDVIELVLKKLRSTK